MNQEKTCWSGKSVETLQAEESGKTCESDETGLSGRTPESCESGESVNILTCQSHISKVFLSLAVVISPLWQYTFSFHMYMVFFIFLKTIQRLGTLKTYNFCISAQTQTNTREAKRELVISPISQTNFQLLSGNIISMKYFVKVIIHQMEFLVACPTSHKGR